MNVNRLVAIVQRASAVGMVNVHRVIPIKGDVVQQRTVPSVITMLKRVVVHLAMKNVSLDVVVLHIKFVVRRREYVAKLVQR